MTDFYIKTRTTIAGPFTGVEVREATLARIVLPETGIGPTRQGPWTRAADAGLFSHKNVPLSHPPDTQVPRFRLTGVSEALQGPLKLRELIGFAAHHMLPVDALVQVEGQSDWTPVTRIAILQACFRGELTPAGVRQDDDSRHAAARFDSRHKSETPQAVDARWRGQKDRQPRCPPAAVTSPAVNASISPAVNASISPAVTVSAAETHQPEALAAARQSAASVDIHESTQDHGRPKLSEFNNQWRTSLRKRSALSWPKGSRRFFGAGAVILAIAMIWTLRGTTGMARDELLGDWIQLTADESKQDQSPTAAFGISFRRDGRCVVLNARGGPSWSGQFEWIDQQRSQGGFANLEAMRAEIADVDPAHRRDVVLPSDGYIKLTGSFVKEPPWIANRSVRHCYVRRHGKKLWLGYVATIRWDRSGKTTEAGWVELTPAKSRRKPVAAPAAGDSLNATTLLETLGLPDEARPLHSFERPVGVDPQSIGGLQLVRYGDREFILSADGEWQDLTKASWQQADVAERVGKPTATTLPASRDDS